MSYITKMIESLDIAYLEIHKSISIDQSAYLKTKTKKQTFNWNEITQGYCRLKVWPVLVFFTIYQWIMRIEFHYRNMYFESGWWWWWRRRRRQLWWWRWCYDLCICSNWRLTMTLQRCVDNIYIYIYIMCHFMKKLTRASRRQGLSHRQLVQAVLDTSKFRENIYVCNPI